MDSKPLRDNNLSQYRTPAKARRIVVKGRVQGVGFRPFIYRLAMQYGVNGWVRNCLGQVEIQAEADTKALDEFEQAIYSQAPAIARPLPATSHDSECENSAAFTILDSIDHGHSMVSVPADLFTCNECLQELDRPEDRRYRYPFINCTQCGPRYTLIRNLPYDRPNTTMAGFELCADCHAEYSDAADRRYHAEPVACPRCGPALEFHTGEGDILRDNEACLSACIKALRNGKVVVVKGVGGYHLMCDAGNDQAISRLRKHKPRPHKPLALMFPAPVDATFSILEQHVELDDKAKSFLASPGRPILLVQKRADSPLSPLLAPGLNELGVMLPYSPLHHLLLNAFGAPLVATSANLSGEPVLIDNDQVTQRLAHVADAMLHHDRPIQRPADDPVFRTINRAPRPIRLGRGFCPLELTLSHTLEKPVLAVGAHMKNTITLAWKNRAVISPHIGEMDSARSLQVFEQCIEDLQQLYRVNAEVIVHDAHPGYTTTRWAQRHGLPTFAILHHHAHAAALYHDCFHHNQADQEMLVFTWDGVGYGDDGTLWGGEALLGKPGHWSRVASIRPFHLPGGERAGREPWRSAAALCWESDMVCPVLPDDGTLVHQAWNKRINTSRTTSVGRLFDAAAALTGLCNQASFEGQGPMLLEACYRDGTDSIDLPVTYTDDLLVADWQPMLTMLCDTGLEQSCRSGRFHRSLANSILTQCRRIRERYAIRDIGFSGGVFQNRVLTELATGLLEADGFSVHSAQNVPVNDAGISFGQIIEYNATTALTAMRNRS